MEPKKKKNSKKQLVETGTLEYSKTLPVRSEFGQ